MSTITPSMSFPGGNMPPRSDVLVQDQIAIPGWINDLAINHGEVRDPGDVLG